MELGDPQYVIGVVIAAIFIVAGIRVITAYLQR